MPPSKLPQPSKQKLSPYAVPARLISAAHSEQVKFSITKNLIQSIELKSLTPFWIVTAAISEHTVNSYGEADVSLPSRSADFLRFLGEKFGGEGFNVALLARSTDNLNVLQAKLQKKKINAAIFRADVLDRVSLKTALENAAKHFGSIDVLEYGPTPPKDSMRVPRDIDVENELLHLNLQVLGAISAVRSVLPQMLERRDGSILFTTAASAQHPAIITASFGVAAGGLLNYARLLHKDLGVDGVRVGIVSIAGVVAEDSKIEPNNFPPGLPVVTSSSIAELHWNLHTTKQDNPEVFAGDIEALLGVPELY